MVTDALAAKRRVKIRDIYQLPFGGVPAPTDGQCLQEASGY
jgi:hypothetical protein